MGFLSDLSLDTVSDDVNAFPDGTYEAFLYEAKLIQYKDTSKGQALVLTYKIADGPHSGKTIDEWKSCNAFDDERAKGWLKARIKSLGVPESRYDTVDPEDLVGIKLLISKKQKGEYHNVTSVKLSDGSSSSSVGASTSASVSDLL
jgi:hypothetical protein